jgi:hypothetical protein
MWNMDGPDGETRIAARRRVRICQVVVKMIQPLWRTPIWSVIDHFDRGGTYQSNDQDDQR